MRLVKLTWRDLLNKQITTQNSTFSLSHNHLMRVYVFICVVAGFRMYLYKYPSTLLQGGIVGN